MNLSWVWNGTEPQLPHLYNGANHGAHAQGSSDYGQGLGPVPGTGKGLVKGVQGRGGVGDYFSPERDGAYLRLHSRSSPGTRVP